MKIYKSIYRTYTTTVSKDDRRYRIHFKDKGQPYGYGVYYAESKEVEAAIEASCEFGSIISLLEDTNPAEEHQEETVFAAEYPDVKRTQSANKILVGEYGVDPSTLNSKADALEAAKKLNISFPNL